jgi:hypothetical protein
MLEDIIIKGENPVFPKNLQKDFKSCIKISKISQQIVPRVGESLLIYFGQSFPE